MRPTLLHFRSPKEKTPEFYDIRTTYTGEALNFKNSSINKRQSNFPQADRFPQFDFYSSGSGVNCFIGPGTYNDHDNYIKMAQ